ncbi:MAG TPA: sugar ABC transporter permease [Ktedonobacteraceae bacterium]|nr:sugar ABC transporter permease [Ktedonobacteraceae bacterium]
MAAQAVEISSRRPSLRERLDLGNGLTPYFLVLPTVFVTLTGLFLPILYSLWLSFLDRPPGPNAEFIGLSNYTQLITNSGFRSSLSTTLIFTLIAVTLETIFGLLIALLLNETFPGRGLVRAAIVVPLAFPLLLTAQLWFLMYNDRTGIISYFLQKMHILAPGATLLQTNSGIITAAIIADVWKNTPFMALLLLAGLQVIPSELYEASKIDGATRFQQFWTITLPMLNGPLTVALLFRTLAALGVFELFYILGGNQVQSMSTYSYNYMFTRSTFDFPPGVAAAVVLFVIVILQITYRFSAMMIVLKGYVKMTSSPTIRPTRSKTATEGQ